MKTPHRTHPGLSPVTRSALHTVQRPRLVETSDGPQFQVLLPRGHIEHLPPRFLTDDTKPSQQVHTLVEKKALQKTLRKMRRFLHARKTSPQKTSRLWEKYSRDWFRFKDAPQLSVKKRIRQALEEQNHTKVHGRKKKNSWKHRQKKNQVVRPLVTFDTVKSMNAWTRRFLGYIHPSTIYPRPRPLFARTSFPTLTQSFRGALSLSHPLVHPQENTSKSLTRFQAFCHAKIREMQKACVAKNHTSHHDANVSFEDVSLLSRFYETSMEKPVLQYGSGSMQRKNGYGRRRWRHRSVLLRLLRGVRRRRYHTQPVWYTSEHAHTLLGSPRLRVAPQQQKKRCGMDRWRSNFLQRGLKRGTYGLVCVRASYHNCIATLVDAYGRTLTTTSPGVHGYKKANRSNPQAAFTVGRHIGQRARAHGIRMVSLSLQGLAANRPNLAKGIQSRSVKVFELVNRARRPHNGCRPPALRRK